MIIDTITCVSNMTSNTISDNGNQVEHYSKLLNDYGITVVILSVFIVLLFLVVGIIIKVMMSSYKQIKKQQNDMITTILQNQEEAKIPTKEKNIIGTFIKINDSIKDALKTISKKVSADRLSVYVFHNGSYSSHGLPFFKTSCVSEIIRKNCGIGRKSLEHSNLSLSIIDDSIKEMYKFGRIEVKNIEEIKVKFPVLHHMLEETEIISATGVAIYDTENKMLGILIAEFITDQSEILDQVTNTLIKETKLLSPVLEFSDYQNLNGTNDDE